MLLTLPPAGIATTPDVPVTVMVPSRLTAVTVTDTYTVVVGSWLVTPTLKLPCPPAASETVAVLPVNWLRAGGAGGATMMMVMLTQLMSPPACRQTRGVYVPFGVVVSGSTVRQAASSVAPRALSLRGSTYQNASNVQPLK